MIDAGLAYDVSTAIRRAHQFAEFNPYWFEEALHPDDYEAAIGLALWQGGDTDTIGAMTGAISGARLGSDAIPSQALDHLEDEHFVPDVTKLAGELYKSVP